MGGVAKNLSYLTHMFLTEGEQGGALPSCVSSHSVNKCPFAGLFSASFSTLLCFLLAILLLKMAPRCSAEVLSSFFTCKKAVTCLMEKICLLVKLHSGMSCSTVDPDEFNVNE